MWLFWDLVSAFPIFPRSKALKQFSKNRKTLGRWRQACYSGFCRREVDKIDGSGPKVSPSLFISFPPPTCKGYCHGPDTREMELSKLSFRSSCSVRWRRQTYKHTNYNILSDRLKEPRIECSEGTEDGQNEGTVCGSALWQNFKIQEGIFWITKEWEALFLAKGTAREKV